MQPVKRSPISDILKVFAILKKITDFSLILKYFFLKCSENSSLVAQKTHWRKKNAILVRILVGYKLKLSLLHSPPEATASKLGPVFHSRCKARRTNPESAAPSCAPKARSSPCFSVASTVLLRHEMLTSGSSFNLALLFLTPVFLWHSFRVCDYSIGHVCIWEFPFINPTISPHMGLENLRA